MFKIVPGRKFAFNKCGGKNKSNSLQLGFETLETRRMFATFAQLVRTDGDVYALATVSMPSGTPIYSTGELQDVGNGNSPYETYASAHITGESPDPDLSAGGQSDVIVVHGPAIGATSNVAQAAVATDMLATANPGAVVITGLGVSDGEYDVDVAGLANPGYHAEFWLHSDRIGFELELGTGQVDVVTNQTLSIWTSEEGEWWVAANSVRTQDHVPGEAHAQWVVSWHLPDRVDGYYERDTVLDEHFSVDWQYDDSDQVRVTAKYDTTGIDQADEATAGEGSLASFAWYSVSQVELYLGNTGDNKIPGKIIDPVPDFAPPKVTDVIIGSTLPNSYNSNPDFDFANHVGSSEQLRTVPVGAADQISVRFSKDVDIASTDLDLIGLNKVVAIPSFSSFIAPDESNDFTATWTFSAALPAAQYELRIADSVVDYKGVALDGEWTNPASLTTTGTSTSFPSGNIQPGGDFEFVFTILPGDADRNLFVTANDLQILIINYNGTGKSFSQGDFTGEGVTNITDYQNALLLNYMKNWQNLSVRGDYDNDYAITKSDETAFLSYYGTRNSAADINQDGNVTASDYDAFYELYDFGINLDVV